MLTDILNERNHHSDRREALFIGLAFTFLTLLAASLSLSTAARTGRWDGLGDRWAHWLILPIWLAGYFLLRRGLGRLNFVRDPLLLPIPMLFMGWGLLTIWRLDPGFGLRQSGWFMLAICCLYFLLAYGRDLGWIRRYRYLWITLGLFLMALTLFLGTHPGGGSPRLWLGCCGFYFQPSEALRLLLVAFLAAFLADRLPFKAFAQGTWQLQAWLPLLFIWLLSFSLLVVQRDLGTGMLFLALLTMLLYLVLDRWEIIAIATVLGFAGGVLGFYLFDVVNVRVAAWLNPFADPLGGSYQIVQSLITAASGGLFGRGLGLGSPGFVPAIHTDFIFTAIVEEHGLLAGLVMIGLWGIWLSRIMSSASRQREPFAALLTAGLGFSLGLQAMLIIGGNLRVFPLVGITLPFTSYGGSSLLVSCLSLGMLLLLNHGQDISTPFRAPLLRLHSGMVIAIGFLAVFLGWWTLVDAPELKARDDNPRKAVDSRYSLRGSIVDRNGQLLAESSGSVGSYVRSYPEPAAAPLVGYDLFPYGQAGLEESLDGILRGVERQNEWRIAWSEILRGVSPTGLDVRLTLDMELQRHAMELLSNQRGAIILLDANSGELLSAASAPSYDANKLEDQWSDLISDPNSPLLNRALQGNYQPGLALAPFIIAWSLENQWISMETPVKDLNRSLAIDGEEITCATPPSGLNNPDYGDVLIYSCPGPIRDLVQEFGIEAYIQTVNQFRFVTPVSPESVEGNVADQQISLNAGFEMAAIGQSTLTVTPVQVAQALATLIGDGTRPELQIVDAIRGEGGQWERYADTDLPLALILPETSAEIRSSQGGEDQFSYLASALAGEPLGWFLGGTRGIGGDFAVVVVLENGSPVKAAEVGTALLERVRARSLP